MLTGERGQEWIELNERGRAEKRVAVPDVTQLCRHERQGENTPIYAVPHDREGQPFLALVVDHGDGTCCIAELAQDSRLSPGMSFVKAEADLFAACRDGSGRIAMPYADEGSGALGVCFIQPGTDEPPTVAQANLGEWLSDGVLLDCVALEDGSVILSGQKKQIGGVLVRINALGETVFAHSMDDIVTKLTVTSGGFAGYYRQGIAYFDEDGGLLGTKEAEYPTDERDVRFPMGIAAFGNGVAALFEPEEGEEGEEEFVYKVVPNDITLKLPAARSVEDNPVHKTKILTVKENNRDIKVGYLMYNSFTAGTNSDPDKYNNELRQISQEFKTAGVKYVILDLRYNTGGSLDCVQLLGTILTSEARLNKPMAYLEYNNKNRDKDATINFDSEILKSGVNLDLPALFAITSSTTAGAPEMLIRSLSLKDSYPVVTIGGVTKGQNVATEQFINEEFLWSINPVVCTVYDSNHDAGGAISPATDLKISETTIDGVTNYSEFLPFGDPNERMLKVAIGVIDGSYPPKDEETEETTKAQFKIEKSVISPASRRFSSNGLRLK